MITKIYLGDIVLDPEVTLLATRFIIAKFYFLLTERIYVFFMVVRTNSDHFLVFPSRGFIAGAACVCCAAGNESFTMVQVSVSMAMLWVMQLVTGILLPSLRFKSQVSPCEI